MSPVDYLECGLEIMAKKLAKTAAQLDLAKMQRANRRSELRRERYNHMLSLGFSAIDARRFRDRSIESIESRIDTRQREITKIRKPKRSASESNQLGRIRAAKLTAPAVNNKGRNKSRAGRLSEFKRWTSARNFPDWAMEYILEANENKGLDPFNSFGYRQFYYRYVNNRSASIVGILADRDDS